MKKLKINHKHFVIEEIGHRKRIFSVLLLCTYVLQILPMLQNKWLSPRGRHKLRIHKRRGLENYTSNWTDEEVSFRENWRVVVI